MQNRRELLLGLATTGLATSLTSGLIKSVQADLYCTVNYRQKWVLGGTFNTSRITTRFGADWVDRDPCYGLIKKHVGIDYTDSTYARAGAIVKASDSGYVKEARTDAQWGGFVVIEHHQCWTTVYWHVIPKVSVGSYVTQGQQIGTIANLTQISGGRYGTHLHFGFRAKPYHSTLSKAGALPQKACSPYPASPEYFVNPTGIAWF